jgi:glycosyltransferase involved in cell wall biosynthesis
LNAAKRVLFISYDGMTDPLGQSQVIPYLSGLTKYGYSFTIISCDKPDKYEANKEYVQQLIQPFPIQWVSLPYHKSPPVLSSVYDFYKIKQVVKRLQAKAPFQMVHTRPGVPTLVALWMKKKYGTKFLNDIRGFWADERVDGGMWNLDNPLYKKVFRFFKQHEYECIIKADHNTCLTIAAKNEIHTWNNIPGQPIPLEVISCSADLELFNPNKIEESQRLCYAEELGIKPTDFIISYLGSIGGWYLTQDMMRLCKIISDKIPAAKFLFISPHRHDQIVAAAAASGLSENKIITVKALRHEVPVLLSFSHFSLFFIKPCYSKISSSPTKHGEIMAMGIPIITNSGVGDVKEIVEKYNAGFVLDDFTDQSFRELAERLPKADFNKSQIIKGAHETYALQNALQLYKKVYQSILP